MSSDFIRQFFKNSEFTCRPMSFDIGAGMNIERGGDSPLQVCIFATRQGWAIDSSGIGFSIDAYALSYSIEEACMIAKGILYSEHLPIQSNDIEISIIRAEGIASQSIKHKPTGITKWIKNKTARGIIVQRQKEEALNQIVMELVEISLRNEKDKTDS